MKTFWVLGLGLLSVAPASAMPQRALWKLPHGAYFEALQRRPDGKVAVYWQTDTFSMQRVLLDQKSGRVWNESVLPDVNVAPDVDIETFNARGQHAFLPYCDARTSNLLRLKSGRKYRILQNLPRFNRDSLQDVKFSPDGEVLKVLGRDRLWIIGAQTGRLLRVIRPNRGKWWSYENAVLSPDAFTILAMRDKMTLFSARTGRLFKKFGVHVETFTGHCGSLEARVEYSPDGRSALATQQGDDSFDFPAKGGKMRWSGPLPYALRFSRDGRFYFDFQRSPDQRTEYPIVKSARSHRIVAQFPALRFSDTFNTPVEFSDDSQAILWVKDGILWRAPLQVQGV